MKIHSTVSLLLLVSLSGCAADSPRPLADKGYSLLESGTAEIIYVDPSPALIMDVETDHSASTMFGLAGAVLDQAAHADAQTRADQELEQHRAELDRLRLDDMLFYNFQNLARQIPVFARAKFTRLPAQDTSSSDLAASSQAMSIVVIRPKLVISTVGDQLTSGAKVSVYVKADMRQPGFRDWATVVGTATLNPQRGDTTLCDLGCLNHWFAAEGKPLQDGLDQTLQDIDQQLAVYFHAPTP